MSDSPQSKGEARARGPSVGDVLASDQQPAPAALTASQYAFLGDADLPASRYTCPDFFRQEMSAM